MKTWKRPEMNLFAVKMDENIAASGQGFAIYHGNEGHGNGLEREPNYYKMTASGTIHDTKFTPNYDSSMGRYWIPFGWLDKVSTCHI